jgi:rod shape-determining protein MreD
VSTLAQVGLLAAAALLQVTLLGRLEVAVPAPNLVLVLVVARAWLRGGGAGMRWALAGGLLLDLTAIGPLGAHALALLGAAYAAGWLAASFENDARAPWLSGLAGAAGGAVYGVVLLGLADSLGLAQVSLRAAGPLVAVSALTTGLLVPPAAALMARVAGSRPLKVPSW